MRMTREKTRGKGNDVPTLLGLAIIATVVLTACGSAIPSNDAATAADAAMIAEQLPADFQISVYQGQQVVGGQEVYLSALLGQGKPVVLNL